MTGADESISGFGRVPQPGIELTTTRKRHKPQLLHDSEKTSNSIKFNAV